MSRPASAALAALALSACGGPTSALVTPRVAPSPDEAVPEPAATAPVAEYAAEYVTVVGPWLNELVGGAASSAAGLSIDEESVRMLVTSIDVDPVQGGLTEVIASDCPAVDNMMCELLAPDVLTYVCGGDRVVARREASGWTTLATLPDVLADGASARGTDDARRDARHRRAHRTRGGLAVWQHERRHPEAREGAPDAARCYRRGADRSPAAD